MTNFQSEFRISLFKYLNVNNLLFFVLGLGYSLGNNLLDFKPRSLPHPLHRRRKGESEATDKLSFLLLLLQCRLVSANNYWTFDDFLPNRYYNRVF